ncbi:hypothetical protein CLROS_024240 [Clostridium felsineum]|uniref:Uncharacterized protein n=1 Tax=Clostridium felsineum TaxID=36839 RepID=A0A1S8MI52_9CLOT|nr:hypothetical protein CLROS_024240 [Clostridium felsineum]URZ12121.1 hypothetical protein CROST_028380 [Clostridium felsineum]
MNTSGIQRGYMAKNMKAEELMTKEENLKNCR